MMEDTSQQVRMIDDGMMDDGMIIIVIINCY